MRRVASKNPRALNLAAELDAASPPLSLPADLCLVLGGDGTMLHAIAEHGPEPTYLGFNCGFLGFLMNDLRALDPAAHALEVLRQQSWSAHRFPRLTMRAHTANGPVEGRAVNDVYVERQSGHTCHLRVSVDGHILADRIVCDGMIAATPLGSTAYSFSAGGPASHPLVRSINLTPICPHAPRLSPIVLPDRARVRIEVLNPDYRPARVVTDGEAHGDVHSVEVRCEAGDDVSLAFLAGHDFTGTLVHKVLRR
jgi:NAD+ kinase